MDFKADFICSLMFFIGIVCLYITKTFHKMNNGNNTMQQYQILRFCIGSRLYNAQVCLRFGDSGLLKVVLVQSRAS